MAVLIKGIKLPNKNEILTLYIDGDGAVRNYDHLTKIGEAVEVSTPHGRLIDADELKCGIPTIEDEYKHCHRILDSAPTIIEAEE